MERLYKFVIHVPGYGEIQRLTHTEFQAIDQVASIYHDVPRALYTVVYNGKTGEFKEVA